MKKKPWLILGLSILHFLMPIWYVFQLTVVYKKDVLNFATYDLLYIALMSIWAIVVGIGLYRMSFFGYWLFIGHIAWVLISYLILFLRDFSVPTYLAAVGIGLTLVAFALPFVFKTIFSPFFNPQMRWWRTPPRFLLTSDVDIKSACSSEDCDIYDINRNGCYLKGDFSKLYKRGEHITFKLYLKEEEFAVKGVVVWMNDKALDSKPQGMGVKFVEINEGTRTRLLALLVELEKQGNRSR